MADRKTVALIGAGRMGSVHAGNAARHPDIDLAFVVDPRPDAAQALSNQWGARPASLQDVLKDDAVEGVLVCSSTDQHLAHAQAALAAGKAVFCEKPIDLDLAKARAAREDFCDARFVLAFNRRFDPNFVALKDQVRAGRIGDIETLQIVNHDPALPPLAFIPTSGGLFRDFTIHDLDLARWLLDEDPVEVFAMASCLVDPVIADLGDVDTARTVLKTASGRLCLISNTRRSGYGYDQRIEAFGSCGMIAADNQRGDSCVSLTARGTAAAPILPDFPSRYAPAYAAEMAHFADVLWGRDTPRATYDDGLKALALADACARSAAEGRAIPVSFD